MQTRLVSVEEYMLIEPVREKLVLVLAGETSSVGRKSSLDVSAYSE